MEPTIYKPGAYKSPGIYNGAGGIYNGRGVYNDNLIDHVEIGGRIYPVVKIGNKYWTTENLDYKYDGLTVGGSFQPNYPAAWYYSNNESEFGYNGKKCGLLYNWYAAQDINNLLTDGWRIPYKSDLTDLVNNIGVPNDSTPIRSNNIPWATSWEGGNNSGMNVLPTGGVYTGFYGLAERAGIISLDYENHDVWFLFVDVPRMKVQKTDKKFEGEGIRLCKDV